MRIGLGAGIAAALVACSAAGGEDGAGRGGTLAATPDGALLAVNVDEGTVTRVAADGGRAVEVPVGAEPTRLAVAGGKVFVTLRAEGAVVVLDATTLHELARRPVGAEPYGVATNDDGTLVWVALSMQDQVVELDGATLAKLRTFEVLDEPRWLAPNPEETALFVGSQRGGRLSRIDLVEGTVRDLALPRTGEIRGDDAHGQVGGQLTIALRPRVTGDPVVTDDGHTLAVPVSYADLTSPVVPIGEGRGGGYAGRAALHHLGTSDLGRTNPALVLFDLDRDGRPVDEGDAVFLGVDLERRSWRSAPTAVVSPDGRRFVVSMESGSGLVVVDREPFRGFDEDDGGPASGPKSPDGFAFAVRPTTPVTTGAGPRGLAFVDGELFVHTFLDRRVEAVGWRDLERANAFAREDRDQEAGLAELRTDHRARLARPSLPDQVERGRRLFFDATDPSVADPRGGMACASCHADGRDDGQSWPFEDPTAPDGVVRLQTPSLVGGIGATAPLTWRDDVGSVAEEALLTSTLRLGGTGPTDDDLLAIEAFVEQLRLPIRAPEPDQDLLALGAEVFARPEVGCATCHGGPRGTDNRKHEVAGLVAATPTLSGVAATAPYLHDGSLRTLREVLDWARDGRMGDTSSLDPHETDALEAWLRSR